MNTTRWIRVFEWFILLGIVVLLGLGMWSWHGAEASKIAVIATVFSPSPIYRHTSTQTPRPSPTSTVKPVVKLSTATSTPTSPPPTWTLTPPPSLTLPPTPTSTPTETLEPIALPLPPPVITGTGVVSSPLPQPTPMPRIRQPRGAINILLLGSDRRPGEKVARTDVMLIVSVFPDVPAVNMISIPRDYYAWIPTWGLDKINTAFLRGYKNGYPGGGPSLAKATIEYNFGVPIHYYAMVDFNGYRKIVDAVGGVDIVVECPFHDTYPDEESETGQTDIDLEPGVHHLTGKYALWYARSRWNTSDFDRHRRQQKVLLAIYHAAMTQNMIPRVPELWSAYQDTVETDMGLKTLIYMGTVAARLDILRDLKSRFIRGSHLIYSMRAPNGGAVLAPHYDALYNFMLEAAQPPPGGRAQRFYRVEVWNGTGNADWGEVAAERLRLEGFEVVRIRDVASIRRTTIVDFTTTSKGSSLPKLMDLYKRQKDDVIAEPKEGSDVDFRVVLGWDYDPCAGTKTARWGSGGGSVSPTATITPVIPSDSGAMKGSSGD